MTQQFDIKIVVVAADNERKCDMCAETCAHMNFQLFIFRPSTHKKKFDVTLSLVMLFVVPQVPQFSSQSSMQATDKLLSNKLFLLRFDCRAEVSPFVALSLTQDLSCKFLPLVVVA